MSMDSTLIGVLPPGEYAPQLETIDLTRSMDEQDRGKDYSGGTYWPLCLAIV
jgi:hypothetical protein